MREQDEFKKQIIWFFHNTLGHPVMELLWWVGYVIPSARSLGKWIHNVTAPDVF